MHPGPTAITADKKLRNIKSTRRQPTTKSYGNKNF